MEEDWLKSSNEFLPGLWPIEWKEWAFPYHALNPLARSPPGHLTWENWKSGLLFILSNSLAEIEKLVTSPRVVQLYIYNSTLRLSTTLDARSASIKHLIISTQLLTVIVLHHFPPHRSIELSYWYLRLSTKQLHIQSRQTSNRFAQT